MWIAKHSETVTATPSDIWAHWIDVAGWPEQDHSLEWAKLDGDFAVGSVISIKPKGSPTVNVRLIEVKPNESYATQGGLPLTTLRFDHWLKPSGKQVTFTQQASMSGPLSWLFSRLLGPSMATNLEKRMKNLATLVSK